MEALNEVTGAGLAELRAPAIKGLIITGGNGYIGRVVAQAAAQRGLSVLLLGRSTLRAAGGFVTCRWELGDPLPPEVCEIHVKAAETALIHLANDWSNAPAAGGALNKNEAGTLALWESARAAGVARLVFVSSQSARQDAENIYGRTKWAIEQKVSGPDTASARIGLVYGGAPSGLFALMMRLSSLPVLPMVAPGTRVQPIHVDEVAQGLLSLALGQGEIEGRTRPFELAAAAPMTFGSLLKTLARETRARHLPILPVPLQLALWGCRLTAYLPLLPSVSEERVWGLVGVKVMEHCAEDLAVLNLKVAPFAERLRREPGHWRALALEARTLLGAILGHRPSAASIRFYIRALEFRNGPAEPLALSALNVALPWTLRARERIMSRGPLERRLSLASSIAEGSAVGARLYFDAPASKRFWRLISSLAIELILTPLRLIIALTRRGEP